MQPYFLLILVPAVLGLQAINLLSLSENYASDSIVLGQSGGGSIVQTDKHFAFWVPHNETTGSIVLYYKEESGDFTEVNRIIGNRMVGYAMAANDEWFVSFDGATRDVMFFKLNDNHQLNTTIKWGFKQLTTFNGRLKLLPNNNLLSHDYPLGQSSVVMYPYLGDSWATTPSASIPSDTHPSLGDTFIATFDTATSVLGLYSINGNDFNFLENVTVPFEIDMSYPRYTYNGIDTVVFPVNTDFVDILEKNNVGQWAHKTATWTSTDDNFNHFFEWKGSDLYISALRHGDTTGLMGMIFKFERLDNGTWVNTQTFQPSAAINSTGYLTYGVWGFAVTDNAVLSLSASFKTNDPAAIQLQYYPECYNQSIPLTCNDKTYLSCDSFNISIATLYSIGDRCGSVTVTSHNSSEIQVDYQNNEFSTTIQVYRFEQTAECTVSIQCGVEPVTVTPMNNETPSSPSTSGSPSATPKGNSPVSNAKRLTLGGLLSMLVTLLCV